MVANVNPPPIRIPSRVQDDREMFQFFNELITVIRQLYAKAGVSISLGDGTATVPGLGFANEPGLGFYRPEDGVIGVTVSGIEEARFSEDGLSVNDLQAASFVYNGDNGYLESAVATNGQILIARTGLSPVPGAITGAPNRITVSLGSGTIALDLPQDIDPAASPTFADLTLSSLTGNSFLFSGVGGAVNSTAAATDGQLLIGSTGNPPVAAALSGTPNQITVTNAAGSITLSLPQNIALGSSPTFLGLTLTGLTPNSYTYSGAGGAITSTAAPTNGQLLIGSTSNPPVLSTLSGTPGEIVVTNGAGSITFSLDTAVSALVRQIQNASPLNGDTVVMTADNKDRLLWLSPAGTIATATVTLPANATSRLGQIAMVGSSQEITALTLNGATTIYGAPTDLQPGDLYTLVKVASNTWATQR